jgi:hypothetical protein
LGIIDQPYIGERFIGGFGTASMVRGIQQVELKVSGTKEIPVPRVL